MADLNQIGIDTVKARKLADRLNQLLANYQMFYMNTRGFHWNIKGEKFFELHLKFEELYTDAQMKIDEIAERILTLGERPLHNFEDYIKNAQIMPVKDETDGHRAVQGVVDGFAILLPLEREILELSDESDDEGTNALMSDYIREQEKLVWMYSAFLNN
ncbi:MAG TPA: Dps family protein [Saprospiraceae bacterium]|nr:Dps family protein [Saprospiraceae bacterium]